MIWRYSFLALALSLLNATAVGQDRWTTPLSAEDEQAVVRELRAALRENDWLAAARIADTYEGQPHSGFSQWSSFLYGWLGRHDLVREMREKGLILSTANRAEPGVHWAGIVEVIGQMDRNARVVILQERHSEVRHRLALLELLAPLREQGFEYLAAEDFSGPPDAYEDAQSPGTIPGFHSARDPIYGQAIRLAIELGYRLIPYEANFPPPDSIPRTQWETWRARMMAENIQSRILDEAPEARVLVFAGEGHGRQVQTRQMERANYSPMARVLADLTGIDPVSIDQTGCERAIDEGGHQQVEEHLWASSVIVEGFAPGNYDIQIQHTIESFDRNGRAAWLTHTGRRPVEIPAGIRFGGEALVIEARVAGESETSTPIDRLYLAAGEDIHLMLFPGEYLLTVYRDGARESERFEMMVP